MTVLNLPFELASIWSCPSNPIDWDHVLQTWHAVCEMVLIRRYKQPLSGDATSRKLGHQLQRTSTPVYAQMVSIRSALALSSIKTPVERCLKGYLWTCGEGHYAIHLRAHDDVIAWLGRRGNDSQAAAGLGSFCPWYVHPQVQRAGHLGGKRGSGPRATSWRMYISLQTLNTCLRARSMAHKIISRCFMTWIMHSVTSRL